VARAKSGLSPSRLAHEMSTAAVGVARPGSPARRAGMPACARAFGEVWKPEWMVADAVVVEPVSEGRFPA